jgi:hypothetical protein
MRRLTLILSDLYLPAEAGAPAEESGYVELPHLEWLVNFAQGREMEDWRRELALDAGGDLPLVAPAHFAARGRIPEDRLSTSWFATPVHLEARLDHVRLTRDGMVRLVWAERNAWCEEFARSFGPELVLHDAGPRGFFLSGLAAPQVVTTDPARVLGADIAASLPRGEGSAAIRRLSAEIEMWLHSAVLNLDRERARVPRLSSLWLWGGGQPRPPATIPRALERTYAGDEPWLAALARAHTGADPDPAPQRFADLAGRAGQCIVELAPMSGTAGSLAHIDAEWLGPARAALGNGVDRIDLLVNDRHFTTRRHSAWRFWRRKRHWMDRLRRPRD